MGGWVNDVSIDRGMDGQMDGLEWLRWGWAMVRAVNRWRRDRWAGRLLGEVNG